MSLLSSPLPHNHLTPLRSSAEESLTPLSSLQLQVLLALTRWPLSNQHLLGFIPLSSFPLFIISSFIFPSLPSVRLILLFPVLEGGRHYCSSMCLDGNNCFISVVLHLFCQKINKLDAYIGCNLKDKL